MVSFAIQTNVAFQSKLEWQTQTQTQIIGVGNFCPTCCILFNTRFFFNNQNILAQQPMIFLKLKFSVKEFVFRLDISAFG